ncbi:hypothetical protein [Enterococcus phage vB_EfaS_Ef6.1]|nr:hypothetical protein [Enterococcus phage vB_EfaS_Ef6.1]
MKEFYTFKVKTDEAGMAMDNAMKVVSGVDFEIDSYFNALGKLKEATVQAWLTPKQVNKVINELYTHNGINLTQYTNNKNTIFVSFL